MLAQSLRAVKVRALNYSIVLVRLSRFLNGDAHAAE